MASPSVALLSALVAGNGRPKRLLVQENAPAFISNIGRIAGATPVPVSVLDIDRTLNGLIQNEKLGVEHVWAVATHRDGQLVPSEWLARCVPYGIPTVELCLGSLFALARRGPSSATFILVSLDAEQTLQGAQLTAMLTSDAAMARRVRRLCLPGADASDYVLDASPRGLEYDEALLSSLVERALSQVEAEATAVPTRSSLVGGSAPAFSFGWKRRLREDERTVSDAAADAAANTAALRLELEQQRSDNAELVRRLGDTERDAAAHQDRASVVQAESAKRLDDLLHQLAGSERQLASTAAESAALVDKLRESEAVLKKVEREAAAAEVAATARAAEFQSRIEEYLQKVERSEHDLAGVARREADSARAYETSESELSAHILRLEAEAAAAEKSSADRRRAQTDLERLTASAAAETAALVNRLKESEEALGKVEREAAAAEVAATARAAEFQSRIEQYLRKVVHSEHDLAGFARREADSARAYETSESELSARILRLEADADAAEKTRVDRVRAQTDLERVAVSTAAENAALLKKLEGSEGVLERVEREAAAAEMAATAREEQLHSRLEAQTGTLAQAEEACAVLGTRVQEVEQTRASLAAGRGEMERRLLQLQDDHQRALEFADARLHEVRTSAEAVMSLATQSWRAKLEATEQANDALKTALAARASEATAYEKAHEFWDAHRLTLDERVAQLKQALDGDRAPEAPSEHLLEVTNQLEDLKRENELLRETQRALASWEIPRRRSGSPGDSEGAFLRDGTVYDLPKSEFIDYTAESEEPSPSNSILLSEAGEARRRANQGESLDVPRSEFTPEYEHRTPPEPEPRLNARGWLRGVASRIRRG